LSQIMEFYPVDAGTIDRRSKTGGLEADRGAATSPVMAGIYNMSPADLDILTGRASHLLVKCTLDFMGSLNEVTGGDCYVVSPAWVGLMADLPDGSIDVLAGLWLAGLAEEYQVAAFDDEGSRSQGGGSWNQAALVSAVVTGKREGSAWPRRSASKHEVR
jgi:hypothetical protein